jgi:hypothetical protein
VHARRTVAALRAVGRELLARERLLLLLSFRPGLRLLLLLAAGLLLPRLGLEPCGVVVGEPLWPLHARLLLASNPNNGSLKPRTRGISREI